MSRSLLVPLGPRDRALQWLYLHGCVGGLDRIGEPLLRLEARSTGCAASLVAPLCTGLAIARGAIGDHLCDEMSDQALAELPELIGTYLASRLAGLRDAA